MSDKPELMKPQLGADQATPSPKEPIKERPEQHHCPHDELALATPATYANTFFLDLSESVTRITFGETDEPVEAPVFFRAAFALPTSVALELASAIYELYEREIGEDEKEGEHGAS